MFFVIKFLDPVAVVMVLLHFLAAIRWVASIFKGMRCAKFFPIRQMLSIGFLYIFVLSVSGCDSRKNKQMIEKDCIQNNPELGKVLRLSELAKVPDGRVCVLYPCQPYVAGSVPESFRINAYLKSSVYAADESHWAFLIAEPTNITLSKFKRSERLDILASHEIQPEHHSKLPKGFLPVNCTSIEAAAIVKIESKNRIFLTMGAIAS